MTAAISLPDALFETAEQTAERLGISRNAFFEDAIVRYLQHMETPPVTEQPQEARSLKEQFNAVYSRENSKLDPLFVELGARSLPKEEAW